MHERRIGESQKRLAREYAAPLGVSGEIHDDDFLYWHSHDFYGDADRAVRAYFDGGRHYANVLAGLIREHKRSVADLSIMDFAAGYGRVARFFPGLFPTARVQASDIHPEAISFLQSLGVDAHPSAVLPDDLRLPETYDVITVLSFFTHLPRHRWGEWLARLAACLKPGGIMIFSTHGTRIWREMQQPPLEPDGFAFFPFSEQKDLDLAEYGNCVTLVDFVTSALRDRSLQLEAFRASHIDHHDVYVVTNTDGVPVPPTRWELDIAREGRRSLPGRRLRALLARLARA